MRKSLAIVLATMLVLVLAVPGGALGAAFTDLQGHWAAADIEALHDMGIVLGDNGLVRPDDRITRAEFLALLLRAEDIAPTGQETDPGFVDVPVDHWARGYIWAATAQGIVQGLDAQHFGLADNLTREQAVTMLVRSGRGLTRPAAASALPFTDMEAGRWSEPYIRDALACGILGDAAAGPFRPADPATRAEVMVMLRSLLAHETAPDVLPDDQLLTERARVIWRAMQDTFNAGPPYDPAAMADFAVGSALGEPVQAWGPMGATVRMSSVVKLVAVTQKAAHLATVRVVADIVLSATDATGGITLTSNDKEVIYRLRLVDGKWKAY